MNIELGFNGGDHNGYFHGFLKDGILTITEYSFECNDDYIGPQEEEFFKGLIANCTKVVFRKGANIWTRK